MANGTAAIALLPLPEIPAAPQPFDERFGGAEGWVDAIIIELADVAMNAAREIEAGGLDPNTRLRAAICSRGWWCCGGRSGSASLPLPYVAQGGPVVVCL